MYSSAFFLVSCLALLPLFTSAATPKIPPYMKFCKRDIPNYNKCLLTAMREAVAAMSDKGEPSLGILPLDPFRFNVFEMNQGSGPVSVNLTFTDLDLHGIKRAIIEDISVEWGPLEMKIELSNDKIEMFGDYIVNGKVLVLPITGSGKGNITLTGVKLDMVISGKEFTKKGKIHVDVNNCRFTLKEVERVYIKLENLFKGDKTLGDQMNKFLNENWKTLLDELKGPMLNGLCQGIKHVANQIYHKIPFEIISPNFDLSN